MKSYSKKGVSPVVATVLLVAISIVLIMLVFLWLRGFAPEAIMKLKKPAYDACSQVAITAEYLQGVGEGQDRLQIKNDGNIPVYGLDILKIYEGESSRIPITEVIPVAGVIEPTLSGDLPKSIEVYPIILGTNEKGEKRPYLCKDNKVEVEVVI